MWLRSPAFEDKDAIPERFTCDGQDLSPPLEWGDAPAATRSFAVLCEDLDAPSGVWRHWAAYDISSDRAGLNEGASRRAGSEGFMQATNDFHRQGYGGPCPPHDHGLHRYRFRLLALPLERLPIAAGATCREVERAAMANAIAEATWNGRYER